MVGGESEPHNRKDILRQKGESNKVLLPILIFKNYMGQRHTLPQCSSFLQDDLEVNILCEKWVKSKLFLVRLIFSKIYLPLTGVVIYYHQ